MTRQLSTMNVVAAALGGMGVGFFIRPLVSPAPYEEPPSEALTREVPANPTAAVESARAESTGGLAALSQGEAGERASVGEESGVLFSSALLEHTRGGIQRGWARVRKDKPDRSVVATLMDEFQDWTLHLGEELGVKAARAEDAQDLAKEDAERGGAFALLARLDDEGGGPFPDVVGDPELFGKFFPSTKPTGSYDGPGTLSQSELSTRKPVPDGSVLTFSAGVFELQDFGAYWRKRYPRDLTLRGAGRNSTLLVLRSDLSANSEVSNLRIEGMTVHANNNYLFDVRGEPMLLTMEDVRVLGWTSGAGSSCAFGTDTAMLRAIDCEFLGGYSGRKGGRLFDVRTDGLMARFERCLISRTSPFQGIRAGATVVFASCQLEDIVGGVEPPSNVYLKNSPITAWNEDAGQPLDRDLNDLFPDWTNNLQK